MSTLHIDKNVELKDPIDDIYNNHIHYVDKTEFERISKKIFKSLKDHRHRVNTEFRRVKHDLLDYSDEIDNLKREIKGLKRANLLHSIVIIGLLVGVLIYFIR